MSLVAAAAAWMASVEAAGEVANAEESVELQEVMAPSAAEVVEKTDKVAAAAAAVEVVIADKVMEAAEEAVVDRKEEDETAEVQIPLLLRRPGQMAMVRAP